RDAFGELGEQRAVALTAVGADIAIGRPAQIGRRNVAEVLGAVIRTERELHRRPPLAEILRQDAGAIYIPDARGVGDGAVGAHRSGQQILKLAVAGVAPANPDALTRGRRIDIEAGARGEPGQRIVVRVVNIVRAAIERHAEARAFGNAPPADAV